MRQLAILLSTTAVLSCSSVAFGQRTGGSVTGIVRDTAGNPVVAANVTLHPGERRAQTDSSGRFSIDGLGDDSYTVRARKFGYRADSWDVKISKAGHADVKFELENALVLLDTIKISASQPCPTQSIRAFLCRRERGGGFFLDYTDIDDKEKTYVGELFYDVPDMLVDFKISDTGPVYSIHSRRSGCITALVDGRPASAAYPIPETAGRLTALEVYTRPDSVPQELREFLWPASGGSARAGRCTVIVYWTNRGVFEYSRSIR